ncbi:MAG: ribulokinase [Propionibacteriaceae bacterium]|jgi:L-ribulokinase|nr:ribulokinase [Propionibacteriaceae bacterium]
MRYLVGVDFGTLSARAVVVGEDGTEAATAAMDFPHAVMDKTLTAGDGRDLPPDFALQVPSDYLVSMEHAVNQAMAESGVDPKDVAGMGLDFTASTILPARADGTPLCESEDFKDNPHAYVKLWKHHGAQEQANRATALGADTDWLARYGGIISSELAIPKALETLEKAPEVYAEADLFVEALDWVIWQLTGNLTHSAAAAGYKALMQDGSFPSPEYLGALNPGFANFVEEKYTAPTLQLGSCAGRLSEEMAERLGLPAGIAVATGVIDAHSTAYGIQALEPGALTAIMGTSNCFIVSDPDFHEVPGCFGAVLGGVVPGLWAYECGQTGSGDILAWFINNCVPERYSALAKERGISVHQLLTEEAAKQRIGQHGLIALDWHNGNRSILNDSTLSGVMVGQTLKTTAVDMYRALLEAIAFGMRVIIDNYAASGVAVREIVAAGGLLKNELLMQIIADVNQVPVSISTSQQAPALGAAINAAVAADVYPSLPAASTAMGSKQPAVYHPNPEAGAQYQKLFDEYLELHDHFGRGGNDVLHRLQKLRG